MTCRFADLDAAYVLGSLSPADRADYEQHLAGCDECTRSVQELAGLPGLLSRVPPDLLDEAAPVSAPPTLLPRLVAAAERHQRRRTMRTALLAAATVAVIATGSALVATTLGDDDTPPTAAPPPAETTAPLQQMTPVGDSRSTGWVALTPLASGGTRLDLTCEYRSSYDGGGGGAGGHAYTYALVVHATDGRTQDARVFTARSGQEVHETGTTTIEVADIEKIVVENSSGDPVLLLSPSDRP